MLVTSKENRVERITRERNGRNHLQTSIGITLDLSRVFAFWPNAMQRFEKKLRFA
jgi:hypothetical protein